MLLSPRPRALGTAGTCSCTPRRPRPVVARSGDPERDIEGDPLASYDPEEDPRWDVYRERNTLEEELEASSPAVPEAGAWDIAKVAAQGVGAVFVFSELTGPIALSLGCVPGPAAPPPPPRGGRARPAPGGGLGRRPAELELLRDRPDRARAQRRPPPPPPRPAPAAAWTPAP